MRRFTAALWLGLVLVVAATAPHAAMPAPVPDEVIILMVIDGVRASEGFDDPEARYFPRLIRDLKPQGTYYSNFSNDGPTLTIPGHAAMVTGVYAGLANDGTQRPYAPTLFERFRKATGAPAEACWVVSHKEKLEVLTHSTDPAYGPAYAARFEGQVYSSPDELLVTRALHRLNGSPVRLMLLALSEPDTEAHSDHWAGYLRALQRADAQVARVWHWLQTSPKYRDRTTLIITSDHGRHLPGHRNDWRSHGDDCDGCRRIFCLVLGPAAEPGRLIPEPHNQSHLFPLIWERLGLGLP